MIARTTILLATLLLAASPLAAATHDVRQHGARGDKQTLDTGAIQAAIDICNREGGGTVFVPSGDYLTGMLRLRSRVTLHLDNGATLWASRRRDDYAPSGHGEDAAFGSGEISIKPDYRYLLVADDEEHITLEGDGTIRGTGDADLRRRRGSDEQPFPAFRLGMLLFGNCKDVAMRDLTVRDSDFWTLHFWRCERLYLRGLTILIELSLKNG